MFTAETIAPKMEFTSDSTRWRVLIFPGGTEIALELRQALGWCKEVELFSAGTEGSNHAPFAFAKHFVVPHITDPKWIEALQNVVTAHRITHIFPAHDDVVLSLSQNISCFTARVVSSPAKTCEIARSKTATLQYLEKALPVPKLYSDPNEITTFPVFLKPDRGEGARGTAKAIDRKQLEALLLCDSNRIILENLPGQEFTVDCFSDRKRGLLYAAGRKRRRIRSGIAMDSVFVNNPCFLEYAKRINLLLEFHGPWFFQVKEDKNGILKLLEVAPRIAGTSALSRMNGVNLPLLALYESERMPFEIKPQAFEVALDRALINRYRHNINYNTIYVDFDDTLVIRGKINIPLVTLLYQALNHGVRLVLITRHKSDLSFSLNRFRLQHLFDEIIHLRANESKADSIKDSCGIFIDDSFSERKAVQDRTGIPVFDTPMIQMLFDERI